ncbi:MAG: Asp-tRNA(Asn)/Glu-tRNA(Gln) amidotransferase subunit GatA, partial [candidate division Zixibacteria bacterium]|nr:Asp-tRNA(Asn)/Glu-tRNA(Gln) amidotransferase subunit GatA [candidate division Zixibacteria bacterium]
MSDLWNLSAVELRDAVRNRNVSAMEALDACLARIEAVEGASGTLYGPETEPDRVHAFIAPLMQERARRQAAAVDAALARGDDPGPLAGVPFAVKDILCVKDTPTTAASRILSNYVAPYTATAVARLEAAGGVMIGKTNLDEFVYGSSTESSAYRPATRNPAGFARVPGGSSGGSAAAVAAGEVMLALGSDTAGSIRQPAAFCGVVGLKPTYGRVSRWGLIAMAASLDCVGPIARTVKDCALALQIMAGADPYDWTTVTDSVSPYADRLDDKTVSSLMRGLKIGWPREYFEDPDLIDPVDGKPILAALDRAAQTYRRMGAEIVPVSLPHTLYAIPTYFVISRVELASDLHRFDGVKYGYRTDRGVGNLFEMYEATRTEGFGVQPKQRVLMGMHVSSAGYAGRLYERALRLRALIRQDFDRAFEKVDVILSATTPTPAFPIGGLYGDTVQMQNADRLTVPTNHAGVPAISLPCGTDTDGLPIGLQLIGPDFTEERLL